MARYFEAKEGYSFADKSVCWVGKRKLSGRVNCLWLSELGVFWSCCGSFLSGWDCSCEDESLFFGCSCWLLSWVGGVLLFAGSSSFFGAGFVAFIWKWKLLDSDSVKATSLSLILIISTL
nr:hypothetical protein [Mesomycoplasma hyorhinis]